MNAEVVKVGQVWADNDKRSRGRKVRVMAVWTHTADGTPFLRPYAEVRPASGNGRKTTISLDRFRAGATGYTLVTDAP